MKTKTQILIVDENAIFLDTLGYRLKSAGYEVLTAADGTRGLAIVGEKKPDIAIIELVMSGIDGMEFLRRAKILHRPIEVIIMAAKATLHTAIAAMKEGASDYIEKPFSPERIKTVIDKLVEKQQAGEDHYTPELKLKDEYRHEDIITRNTRMKKIIELIKVVANSQATVLITGESGTGKELAARAIHSLSQRRDRPFIALSCAALPENQLEGELFGSERDSLTGDQIPRKGKIELAHRGTIFLNEIGETSANMQVKLLRVLEGKEVTRAGGNELIKADVRLISATNHDLQAAVKSGRFREDLYYRLNVVTIDLPPLRERAEDIPLLAAHFLDRSAAENQKNIKGFSREIMDFMVKYPWPGNIRELKNSIERAVIMTQGKEIQLTDLLQRNSPLVGRITTGRTLQEVEREHILNVLNETGGNLARAAKILGISRATLYNKSRTYGLKTKKEKMRV